MPIGLAPDNARFFIGEQPFSEQATLETWRDAEHVIRTQISYMFKNIYGPDTYGPVTALINFQHGMPRPLYAYHLSTSPPFSLSTTSIGQSVFFTAEEMAFAVSG